MFPWQGQAALLWRAPTRSLSVRLTMRALGRWRGLCSTQPLGGPGWAALPDVASPSGATSLLGCSCWRVSYGKLGTPSGDTCHFRSWPVGQSPAMWSQDLCHCSVSPPGGVYLPRSVADGQLSPWGWGCLGFVSSGDMGATLLCLLLLQFLLPSLAGAPGGAVAGVGTRAHARVTASSCVLPEDFLCRPRPVLGGLGVCPSPPASPSATHQLWGCGQGALSHATCRPSAPSSAGAGRGGRV